MPDLSFILIPPRLLIIAVLGSILLGVATPTEAKGVGTFFALLLSAFYKQFRLDMLIASLLDTAKTSAMVFILLFGASAFTSISLFGR